MGSRALEYWQERRAKSLDRLIEAHATYAGTGPGRRFATGPLNEALVLRLAAEFQGFSRELLYEGVAALMTPIHHEVGTDLAQVVEQGMLSGLNIERGNANPRSLGSDFQQVFALDLWPTLQRGYSRTSVRQGHLENLNRARNAIAHDDQVALTSLHTAGWPIRLETIRRCRRALDNLAQGMDRVLGSHLKTMLGVRPW